METQRVALTLPSEARAHITRTPQIKWGDLDLDLNGEIAEASGAGVDINPNYKAASLASFRADQCALEKAPSTPIRRVANSPDLNEGRADQTPPYKAHQSPSQSPSQSPRDRSTKKDAPSSARGRGDVKSISEGLSFLDITSEQQPWSSKARKFYGIGDPKRLDQRSRNGNGPSMQDDTRLVCARLHHASNELQLRIETRRFETAQLQLQIQVEKTSTAKAQLAVEKARRQIRQLDIELELKSAATATAKSDRDVARDVARQADLNKQVAVAQLKKDAAQLQLDAQDKRAVTTDLDLQLQQRQMARAYVGLQQTRLRNEQDPQVQLAVDAALVDLGVIKPYAEPQWDEPQLDFQCTCGFSTEDPAEVGMHLDMHADEAEKEAARADKEERFRLRQAALKAEIEQGKQRIAVLQEAHHLQKEKFAGFGPNPAVPSAQEKPKAKRKKAKAARQQEGQVKQGAQQQEGQTGGKL